MEKKCTCERKKHRSEEVKRRLVRRLSIIEGQVKGVRGMIEEDAYCPDVLTQISAIGAALDSLSRELLYSHINECVAEDIRAGVGDAPRELCELVGRLIK
ncbi:MAG: metal-sensing transcriptional repressor [Clostridia bacterium]|nr:metal-sensing transcriptional repressor [Clostridia bacterium]